MTLSLKDSIPALIAHSKAAKEIHRALKVLGYPNATFTVQSLPEGARFVFNLGEHEKYLDILFTGQWGYDLYTSLVMLISEAGGMMKLKEYEQPRIPIHPSEL